MSGKTKLFALLAAASFSAHAALWNFSYTFSDSVGIDGLNVVTGTFTGDENGLYVENLADVHAYINGYPLLGDGTYIQGNEHLVWEGSTPDGRIPPAVASPILSLNNFVFTEFPNYGGRGFVMYNDQTFDRDVELWLGPNDFDGDWPGVQENWILTRADLPEPGSLALLAIGLAGLATWRRLPFRHSDGTMKPPI